jgi:hemolysin activation/secretion protein
VELFRELWGGDGDFNRYSATAKFYWPFAASRALGLRGDLTRIDGRAPFYLYPFLEMRGLKALRHRGERTMLAEGELRWSVTPRWTLVGFGGMGQAFTPDTGYDRGAVFTQGLGVGYLIARRLGLQMGLDLARGPEDVALCFQVDSAWLR